MTRTLFLAIFLFLISTTTCAGAEGCHFNSENAIVCTTPENAAFALQNFGFDTIKTDLPYNLKLLNEIGCSKPYNPDYRKADIRQMKIVHIPTPSGRLPVIYGTINGKDNYYFAEAYVEGSCKRSVTPEAEVKSEKKAIESVENKEDKGE